MDRKYRQSGYMDEEPRQKRDGPRPPREDLGGPKAPRFPARITVSRCANCGALLPKGFDPNGKCFRCAFELHSCKQCVHFDTAAHWECTRPIPARVAPKDARNECTFFEFRMSSERETTNSGAAARPDDPRKAFESLFKK
jgi:hypothetical protein